MKGLPAECDGHGVRRSYHEATATWWFSRVHVVQVLTQQADDLSATGLPENQRAAKSGGGIAKRARAQFEPEIKAGKSLHFP